MHECVFEMQWVCVGVCLHMHMYTHMCEYIFSIKHLVKCGNIIKQ